MATTVPPPAEAALISGSGGSGPSTGSGSGGSPSSGTGTPGAGGSTPAAGGSTGAAGGVVGGTNTCVMSPLAVANPIISNFDEAADMGLDVMAVSPGGKWTLDKDASAGTAVLAVEDSGAADQKKAAHFHGAGLTTWGADMAATLSGRPRRRRKYLRGYLVQGEGRRQQQGDIGHRQAPER